MYSLLTKDQFFTRVIHFLESRALNKKTIETTFQFGIFFSLTSFHHLRNLGFNISDSSSMTFSQTTTSLVGKESVSKIIILVVIITITHIFIFFSISIIFSFFSISIIVYLFSAWSHTQVRFPDPPSLKNIGTIGLGSLYSRDIWHSFSQLTTK